MSQSETWDALCLAAEWRTIGRYLEAEREMPEPEVRWVRRTGGRRYPRLIVDEWADSYEDREPVGDQIRAHRNRWDRHDWLAWIGAYRPLVTSTFDPMLREHYNPQEVARMALQRNVAIGMLAGSPDYGFVNPTTYRKLQGRLNNRLPFRRNLTAALTALPGYRGHGS